MDLTLLVWHHCQDMMCSFRFIVIFNIVWKYYTWPALLWFPNISKYKQYNHTFVGLSPISRSSWERVCVMELERVLRHVMQERGGLRAWEAEEDVAHRIDGRSDGWRTCRTRFTGGWRSSDRANNGVMGIRPRRAVFSGRSGERACVPSARTIAVFELRAARFLTQTALFALIYWRMIITTSNRACWRTNFYTLLCTCKYFAHL